MTEASLRVLGSAKLDFAVQGCHKVVSRWIPIVPNSYLKTNVLLGVDILGQAPLKWNHSTELIEGGDSIYLVRQIQTKSGETKQVKPQMVEPEHQETNLVHYIRLEKKKKNYYHPTTVSLSLFH